MVTIAERSLVLNGRRVLALIFIIFKLSFDILADLKFCSHIE